MIDTASCKVGAIALTVTQLSGSIGEECDAIVVYRLDIINLLNFVWGSITGDGNDAEYDLWKNNHALCWDVPSLKIFSKAGPCTSLPGWPWPHK